MPEQTRTFILTLTCTDKPGIVAAVTAATRTEVVPDIYVNAGLVATCAGRAAAIDYALSLVAHHHGYDIAGHVSGLAVLERFRHATHRQRLPFQRMVGPTNDDLVQAVGMMMENMDSVLPIDEIAECVGLSRRHLERRFKAEFNLSPARYYTAIRMERANLLLRDSTLSIVEVAAACGFSSSYFTKLYKAHYDTVPNRARQVARSARQFA